MADKADSEVRPQKRRKTGEIMHELRRKMTILYEEDPTSPMKVTFDQAMAEYMPGETITGHIIFDSGTKAALCREIKVNILGVARTTWAISDRSKFAETKHAATECYIDDTFMVAGGEQIAKAVAAVGEDSVSFPFEYKLPSENLPSTYIDAFGSITYVAKGIGVKRGEQEKDGFSAIGSLLIHGGYDLNEDPDLNQRAELYDHKPVGCCCMKKGNVEILVQLNHRGFVAGDRVSFHAEIQNNSTHQVRMVFCRLLQHALFHSPGGSKTDTKVVKEVHAGNVAKKSSEVWEGYIPIPVDIQVTNLGGGSKLIHLNYTLQFELDTSGCSKNLKSDIPIAIGTIALKSRNSLGTGPVQQFGKEKGSGQGGKTDDSIINSSSNPSSVTATPADSQA